MASEFKITMQRAPWFDPTNIAKQIRFGTARALTQVAKDAAASVRYQISKKFTNRKGWFEQQTPLGIKFKPATKETLQSEVKTAAYFLPLQDTGGTKLPYRHLIAIPTTNVQPTKASRIPPSLYPKNLPNKFEIVTKKGVHLLCIRGAVGSSKRGTTKLLGPRAAAKAGGKSLLVMYVLVTKASIKKTDVFEAEIRKVCERDLQKRVANYVNAAIRDMK